MPRKKKKEVELVCMFSYTTADGAKGNWGTDVPYPPTPRDVRNFERMIDREYSCESAVVSVFPTRKEEKGE